MSEFHYGQLDAVFMMLFLLVSFGERVNIGGYSFVKTKTRRFIWATVFFVVSLVFWFKGNL